MFSSSLQDGVTALLMASQDGHEEVVRLLLQSGAKDVTSKVCNTSYYRVACITNTSFYIYNIYVCMCCMYKKWSILSVAMSAASPSLHTCIIQVKDHTYIQQQQEGEPGDMAIILALLRPLLLFPLRCI